MTSLAIFDLDDTLIDTRGDLVPDALLRTAAAAGVPVERLNPRGKTAQEVLGPAGPLDPERRRAAEIAWYSPDVPPLEPLPGAREALAALKGRIRLALVTRGNEARQRSKIAACGLGPAFAEIRICPPEGSKERYFRELLEELGVPPERCAVVGDDPIDELTHARNLGCLAIAVPEVALTAIPRVLEEAGLLAPETFMSGP